MWVFSPWFLHPLLFLVFFPTSVRVLSIPRSFSKYVWRTYSAPVETWMRCSLSSAQQCSELRRASKSSEWMTNYLVLVEGKCPSHTLIPHLYGQHPCAQNGVSCSHQKGLSIGRQMPVQMDIPLTNGWTSQAALEAWCILDCPLIKSFAHSWCSIWTLYALYLAHAHLT